jgi:hypothetical protein
VYHSANNGFGVGVGVISGVLQVDDDNQALVDDVIETNRTASKRGEPSVFALVVDRKVPPPPAMWRKRFSDVNKQLPHTPHYMLFVTESGPARGVFTAVAWLTGTPYGHTYKALGSSADADAWLTTQLGERFAVIEKLEAEARGNSRLAHYG